MSSSSSSNNHGKPLHATANITTTHSAAAAPKPTAKPSTTTYPLIASALPKDHRVHIARFTTPKPLQLDNDLVAPVTLSRRELRDLPRALPQSVINAQAKAAAAAAAAAEQSAEQAAAEAKASGQGMALAALGKAAGEDNKDKTDEQPQQKKYPMKKEKQVADPSKIAPYGGARVPNTAADDANEADPTATPATAAGAAAAPKSSGAFQKRTREIRMVDDAVRLARREEITPWVLHGADPGASEKAARKLKRRTLRKQLEAAGRSAEAQALESSEEEEEEEEAVEGDDEEKKNEEEKHEDKMDVDAKPEDAQQQEPTTGGPRWRRKGEKEKFRYRVPEADERVFLGAREDPQSEYFLFVYDTEPVPGLSKPSTSTAHFKVTPVSNWFKFSERNLRAPTITADQAEELIKLKRSRRGAAAGGAGSAAAKLLQRITQNEKESAGEDSGAGGTGRISTKRTGGSAGGKGDWGDVDELDFDLTEQFADDEEDVVGDLEDENEGFKSQVKQMFALGVGGEAMDDDFDDDFLAEDTAGAAKAGGGAPTGGAKGNELSAGGKQMIKLLRSQGYESEGDEDDWFEDDDEDGAGEGEAAGQGGGEQTGGDPAVAKPSDSVMRALAAAATAKTNGGQVKRTASAANLDPSPQLGSGGQNPNAKVPPFSRDEIRATLRARGPLTAGQLIHALPRGQEQIAVYGKEAFVDVLKQSSVQKDANKKLHLRQ